MSLYILLLYCFYHLTCLCKKNYGLSTLVGYWSSAFIKRIIYKFLNACPIDYTAFAVCVALPIEDRERNLTKSILARVCTLNVCGYSTLLRSVQ